MKRVMKKNKEQNPISDNEISLILSTKMLDNNSFAHLISLSESNLGLNGGVTCFCSSISQSICLKNG